MMKKNTIVRFCLGLLVLCLFFKAEVKAQKYALVFDVTHTGNGCFNCTNSMGCIQRLDPSGASPIRYFYPPNNGINNGTREVYNIRVDEDPRNYNWVYAQAQGTTCSSGGSPSCIFPTYSNIPIYSGPSSCGTATLEDLGRPGINIKTKYSGPINAPVRVDLKPLTDMCDEVVAIQSKGFSSGTFSWQVTRDITDTTSWVEFGQSTSADAMGVFTTNVSKAILSNVIGPINYGESLNIRVSAPGCWSPVDYRRSPPTLVSFRSSGPASYSTLKTSPTCVGGTDGKIEVYGLKNADGSAFTSTDSLIYSLTHGPNKYNIKSNTRDVIFDQTVAGGSASIGVGAYTVLIENASRTCSTPASANLPINIVDPLPLTLSALTISQAIVCSGGKGTISATITNGKAPYSYSIDDELGVASSSSSMAFPNLLSGNHKVSVTDFCGQSVDTTLYLGEPAAVVPSLTGQNVSCAGQSNGTLKVTASGGTSPYAVQVDGGTFANLSTTPYTVSNLTAGNHQVTIRDANGCTTSQDIVINTNAAVKGKIQPDDLKNGTYAGLNNGQVTLTAVGSSGVTFEYSLNGSPYQLINAFAGLSARSYDVSIRDKNAPACRWDSTVLITEPPQIRIDEFVVASAISCYGESNGSMRASASGGTPQFWYTYSLLELNSGNNDSRNSSGSVVFSNLSAGNYRLTVADGIDNCFVTRDLVLSEPTAVVLNPSLSNYNGQQVSCASSSDGAITIRSTGGVYPHRISVSGRPDQLINSSAEAAVFNNFQAGDYFFTVSSNNGACQKDTLIRLIAPPAIGMNVSAKSYGDGYQVSCKGSSNGIVSAKGSGGTHPYSYSIAPAGTPLSYNQVNLDSVSFSHLSAGQYTIHLTDINNCMTTAQIVLTEPDELKVSDVIKPDIFGRQLTCHGDQNAAVTVYTTGGSYPQTISLQSTTQQGVSNSQTQGIPFSNLGAGSYALSIVDEEGCTATGNFTLIEPDVVALQSSETLLTKPDCAGQPTGSLHLQALGGIGTTYQYQLTFLGDRSRLGFPYPAQQTQTGNPVDFSALIAGSYSLQVSDEVGCIYEQPLPIPTNLQVRDTLLIHGITCKEDQDGSASIKISGGIAPYTLLWNYQDHTIQTNNNVAEAAATEIHNLKEGLYTFEISDANGCGYIAGNYNFQIEGPAEALVLGASTTPITCHGNNDGLIILEAKGGWQEAAYLYGNNSTSLGINQTIYENLGPGMHRYFVKDNKGCMDTLDVNIHEPEVLSAFIAAVKNVSCNGLSDGNFQLNINGGTGPYALSTDNGVIWKTGTNLEALRAGAYTVNVKDSKGCATALSGSITEPSVLHVFLANQQNTLCKQSTGAALVNVSGGSSPYQVSWNNSAGQVLGTQTDIHGLTAGQYVFQVTDDHSCSAQLQVNIINTNDIIFDVINIQGVRCFGESNGHAEVSISTIQAPYTIAWDNGITNPSVTNLAAGQRSVTLEDANQCQVTQSFVVPTPDAMTLSAIQKNSPTCYGLCNGQLTVSPSGGTGSYTYNWQNNPSVNPTILNACAGDYQLSVRDANNCLLQQTITLTGPSLHKMGMEDTTYYICQGQTVAISLPLWTQHHWSSSNGFSSETSAVSLNQAGSYSVQATDLSGCNGHADFKVVYSNDLLKAEFLIPKEAFIGDTVVCVNISLPPPDLLVWDFDHNHAVSLSQVGSYNQLVFLNEGSYTVALTSHLGGCQSQQIKTITIHPKKDIDDNDGNLGYHEKGIKELIVFPNPNEGRFRCSVSLYEMGDIHLRVLDVYGKMLTEEQAYKIDQLDTDLSIEGYPSGLYWLIVETNDDTQTFKVLVR